MSKKNYIFIALFALLLGGLIPIALNGGALGISKITSAQPEKTLEQKGFYEKLNNKESIRILVVGDSIGESKGANKEENKWFNKLEGLIKQKYGSSSSVRLLTIPDGTVFNGLVDYDIYNGEKYDLIFICYGQYDQDVLDTEDFKAMYEALVVKLMADNPKAEMYSLIESSLFKGGDPNIINAITSIANYHGVESIDLRARFTGNYDSITVDGVHPNGTGYDMYANQIFRQITGTTKLSQTNATTYLYNRASLYVKKIQSAGFSFNGTKPGQSTTVDITGEWLGVYFQGSPFGGIAEVYVDDTLVKTVDTYVAIEEKKPVYIGAFKSGKHKVTVKIAETRNQNSQGNDVAIKRFISN